MRNDVTAERDRLKAFLEKQLREAQSECEALSEDEEYADTDAADYWRNLAEAIKRVLSGGG